MMLGNKINGYRNRCQGYVRELWGEITGKEELFSDGLRQRMIGRLESYRDMPYFEAEQQVDQLRAD